MHARFCESHVWQIGFWPSHFSRLARHWSHARDTRERFAGVDCDSVPFAGEAALPRLEGRGLGGSWPLTSAGTDLLPSTILLRRVSHGLVQSSPFARVRGGLSTAPNPCRLDGDRDRARGEAVEADDARNASRAAATDGNAETAAGRARAQGMADGGLYGMVWSPFALLVCPTHATTTYLQHPECARDWRLLVFGLLPSFRPRGLANTASGLPNCKRRAG